MFTRYDILLIVGLIVAALLGLSVVIFKAGTVAVDTVVVEVNGEEVIRAPLADDRQFSVEGPRGKTEMEIKDGRVRVIDSPCPRKTCVHTGWIHKSYQMIICMPNRVVIDLTGGSDNDELDGITG